MVKRIRILNDVAVDGRHLAASSMSSEKDAIADALIAHGDAVYVPPAPARRQRYPQGALARRLVLVGDSFMGMGAFSTSVTAMAVADRVVTVTAAGHALFAGTEFFMSSAGTEYDGVYECASRIDANMFTYVLPDFPQAQPVILSNTLSVVQRLISDRNWIQYANYSLGNPFVQIRNVGGNGNKPRDVLARLERDVLSVEPDVVALMVGINAVTANIPDEQIRADLTAIVTTILDAGCLLIWHTLAPLNAASASYTADRGRRLLRINAFIRQLAQRTPGIILIDAHAALCDPLSSTGDYKSGLASSDGLHLSAAGAQVLGKAAATVLSGLFSRNPPRISSIQHNFVADALSTQINDNPLMLAGAGGTSSGSVTQTDPIPEGYTVIETGSGSVTVTTPARADGLGEDMHLVFVAIAANDEVAVTLTAPTALASRVSAGDRLTAECSLRGTGLSNVSRIDFWLEITVDTVVYVSSGTRYSLTTAWLEDFDLWVRVPEFTVPSGDLTAVQLRMRVQFGGAGGATIDYGVATIEKIIVP